MSVVDLSGSVEHINNHAIKWFNTLVACIPKVQVLFIGTKIDLLPSDNNTNLEATRRMTELVNVIDDTRTRPLDLEVNDAPSSSS